MRQLTEGATTMDGFYAAFLYHAIMMTGAVIITNVILGVAAIALIELLPNHIRALKAFMRRQWREFKGVSYVA